MDFLIIENVAPYDGRYELDLAGDQFTTREWGWVKRFAGYLPGNLEAGLLGMDAELICAFAAIALHRAGKIDSRDIQHVYDRIADAPFGSTIRLEAGSLEVEEEDADPPPLSSNGNESSSGPDSTTSSETSPAGLKPSGIPVSDSSGSDPARWVT